MTSAVLVAPSEPPVLRAAGTSSSVPEQYGADILIGASWGLVGVQRKVWPGDFIASMRDTRFTRSLAAMAPLAMRLLLLEGQPTWTPDGKLWDLRTGTVGAFTLSQLRRFLLSLQHEWGVCACWTANLTDTVAWVADLAAWAEKDRHDSTAARGGPATIGEPRTLDWRLYLLQGIEGVGPELAKRIVEHFDGLPLAWTVTRKQLGEVPGLGPKRLDAMCRLIPAKGMFDDPS